MCRNIRTLHNFEPPATREEVHAAALQYVRKVSGTSKPSAANAAAVDAAVAAVEAATATLLEQLVTSAAPRDRETEAARARARNEVRFARRSAELDRTGPVADPVAPRADVDGGVVGHARHLQRQGGVCCRDT